jgi:hypothetical protein
MSEKMPLLFSKAEAASYLHLETEATLEWLESNFKLEPIKAGRQTLYWKKDLDAVAYKLAGERVPPDLQRTKPLNLARDSA